MLTPDGDSLSPIMMEIHHIRPTGKGGEKSNLNNMTLLHQWCHKSITKSSYSSPDESSE